MGVDRGFAAFYRVEHPAMVRALALAFADRDLAEESAQVGFERAYERWRRVSGYERPGAWVYVVAVRYGRREATRRARDIEVSGRDEGDEEAKVVNGLWIGELIDRLPPRQREAVVLRHLADLRLSDIAEAQGVTIGTVKASLHSAYVRLRVRITEDEEVEFDAHG